MEIKMLACVVVAMAMGNAHATLYTFTFENDFDAGTGLIPDADTLGWTDTQTLDFGGGPSEILDVNVSLELSGGYNGDLYGYLVHSSGFTVLLNRVGVGGTDPFGYDTAGMTITLSDGATDIHTVSSPTMGGTYAPDGRDIDPNSSPAAFDAASRQNGGNPLGVFNGLSADGDWTLFLADLAGGDTSTLVSWGLEIEVVPEPVTSAMILFGGVVGAVGVGRFIRRRAQLGQELR